MRTMLVAAFVVFSPVQTSLAADQFVIKTSAFSVSETLNRLTDMLSEEGITVFARINHAAGAAGVGEKLRPNQVLIFGNAMAGTALMQSDPQVGLDLPMKVLAHERGGKVQLIYTHPDVLKARYGITDRDKVISAMTEALDRLTTAAATN